MHVQNLSMFALTIGANSKLSGKSYPACGPSLPCEKIVSRLVLSRELHFEIRRFTIFADLYSFSVVSASSPLTMKSADAEAA